MTETHQKQITTFLSDLGHYFSFGRRGDQPVWKLTFRDSEADGTETTVLITIQGTWVNVMHVTETTTDNPERLRNLLCLNMNLIFGKVGLTDELELVIVSQVPTHSLTLQSFKDAIGATLVGTDKVREILQRQTDET